MYERTYLIALLQSPHYGCLFCRFVSLQYTSKSIQVSPDDFTQILTYECLTSTGTKVPSCSMKASGCPLLILDPYRSTASSAGIAFERQLLPLPVCYRAQSEYLLSYGSLPKPFASGIPPSPQNSDLHTSSVIEVAKNAQPSKFENAPFCELAEESKTLSQKVYLLQSSFVQGFWPQSCISYA